MCGIAGCVNRDRAGPVAHAQIRAMTDAIAHRGPDGEGTWMDGPIGLGHRRLAIIDPAGGRQPMQSADGAVHIVFNGAIYNHVELRDELAGDHEFRTRSDTEVILHLYAEYGPGCVDRLNGMFAFAIWDARRETLLLARDRLGIKPLYWTFDGRRMAFASEIKALIAGGMCDARPNPDAVREYLTYQFTLEDCTLFSGVHRLEPAHRLILRPFLDERPRIERYWDFGGEIDASRTFEQFRDELRELLDDSVKLQLRADVPIGAYLSGGTDSSVVTSLATRRLDRPLDVFCGAFDDGPEYDESEYARLVARHLGANYHEVRPTADDFCRLMPKLIHLMDEPAAGPGLFPQYCVSALAARQVKVCLGGQGGDELFGGYARYLVAYLEQCLKGAIYGTNRDDRFVVTWEAIEPHLPMLRTYQPMLQDFWRGDLFGDMDRRYFRLVCRDDGLAALLTDDVWSPADRERSFERFRGAFQQSTAPSYFSRMTRFDMLTMLPALLQVEDRVSMGVGLESRVPLLDHRIVELVTAMPPVMRFEGGRSKHVLREAAADLAPASVLNRTDKMGFPVPFNAWLAGPIREFVCDTLLGRAARSRGIYRTAALEQQLTRSGKFSRTIWGLLCLEIWHQQFIDRPGVDQPSETIDLTPAAADKVAPARTTDFLSARRATRASPRQRLAGRA